MIPMYEISVRVIAYAFRLEGHQGHSQYMMGLSIFASEQSYHPTYNI